MKPKDTLTLVSAKLKTRKLRTTITIGTTSILYGVIIAVLFIMRGFFDGMAYSAANTLGGPLLIISYPTDSIDNAETQARAIQLYEESDDPDKEYPVYQVDPLRDENGGILIEWPPMLVQGNLFAAAAAAPRKAQLSKDAELAVADLAKLHQGRISSLLKYYGAVGDGVTIDKIDDSLGYGSQVAAIDDEDILAPFIKMKERKDNVVQILLPLNQAARLLDVTAPSWKTPNSTASLKDYINKVNDRAIGHQFTGIIDVTEEQAAEITYEIVGLLPPVGIGRSITFLSTVKNETYDPNINPLELTVRSLQEVASARYDFIVTNPDSTAFQSSYDALVQNYVDVIVGFDSIKQATGFKLAMQPICMAVDYYTEGCIPVSLSELGSNQLDIQSHADFINTTINTFTIIFTIIATIVMAGTISRVVSDERQTIALYRTVGASTKNILQVFSAYILTICLLIITFSTIIGLTLSLIITATNTATITANVSAMHNVPNLQPLIFIGFDLRITLIYLAIFGIGTLSLLLVLGKLAPRNIVKELRK